MTKNSHDFEIISKRIEYKNPFMEIFRQDIRRPDGKITPYWVLDRGGDFSIIIPFFADKTTQLVGQYRVPIKKFAWEFPMGMVAGATPLRTAKQELREETGLRAKSWKKLGKYHLAPGFSGQQSHVFLAEDITIGKSQPEEDEFITTKRVSLKEVKTMIESGVITDGPTIIAFYLFEQRSGISL